MDLSSFSEYTVSYNPCSPTLSAPTEMLTIDAAWATCVTGIQGFFDPAYALSWADGLTQFSTTSAPVDEPVQVTTTNAVERSTPSPVTTLATRQSKQPPKLPQKNLRLNPQ